MEVASSLISLYGHPHSLWLVLLSVAIAICSGYVGLGLASQATNAFGLYRRGLIAGAAWSLGLGIWTMHFVGMLAVVMPVGTLYSVLLTLLSFLLCVLVVGVAAYMVSNYRAHRFATVAAAIIMGMGIVLMHYLGMHAIIGSYMLHHDLRFSVIAALIAIAASYSALRMFESETTQFTLTLSAIKFGLAVSGMHYTAMMGMKVTPTAPAQNSFGSSVSSDALMIVVSVLAFIVSAVFLLYLIPEKKIGVAPDRIEVDPRLASDGNVQNAVTSHSQLLAEVPEKKASPAFMVPVESEGTTRLLAAADIHAVHATTHYCMVYDGEREYFSPWSISEMENKLDKDMFMRVHRSHLVNVSKVRGLKKAGDGAVLELGNIDPQTIPVSRSNYASLKTRLGLHAKLRNHVSQAKAS
jgi:diguanylate cyclase